MTAVQTDSRLAVEERFAQQLGDEVGATGEIERRQCSEAAIFPDGVCWRGSGAGEG